MTINALHKEIIMLKKEHDFCILAHAYQAQEIKEVADFTGDESTQCRCCIDRRMKSIGYNVTVSRGDYHK